MMLMMVVFSIMSAGLFYASRVPAIQEEMSVLIQGRSSGAASSSGQFAQIAFIMFTFCSPLVLAGVLSTAVSVMRWFDRGE
jgi:hypothetical protein